MTIRTIFVGPLFDAHLEERAPAAATTRFAIELAARERAHLAVGVGSCKLNAPSAGVLREARALINAANEERGRHAQTLAESLLTEARAAGASADVVVHHEIYADVTAAFTRMARLSDVAVMQPSDETLSLTQGAAEEVLFSSGRPVIFVPPEWTGPLKLDTIAVAWDGSAKAARAVGDAMPLLEQAGTVEILAAGGDPDRSKRIDGADLAPHLARHCRNVRVVNLPERGDVGETLREHARLTRADLLVMGAYAHTRLRQMVLGGVTSRMIVDPVVPTLMSY